MFTELVLRINLIPGGSRIWAEGPSGRFEISCLRKCGDLPSFTFASNSLPAFLVAPRFQEMRYFTFLHICVEFSTSFFGCAEISRNAVFYLPSHLRRNLYQLFFFAPRFTGLRQSIFLEGKIYITAFP